MEIGLLFALSHKPPNQTHSTWPLFTAHSLVTLLSCYVTPEVFLFLFLFLLIPYIPVVVHFPPTPPPPFPVSMRRLTPQKRKEIGDMLREGKPPDVIAKTVGVCKSTVADIRQEIGLPPKRASGRAAKINPVLENKILKKFYNGEYTSAAEATRKLNKDGISVCQKTMCKLMKKHGLETRRILELAPVKK
ncbi:hypothetical protein BDF14DRAFT_1796373 [Spinellus fusiger]|nr:hypothetical protein BDF14DRAFT_1796373 [Spinellus fusiger]